MKKKEYIQPTIKVVQIHHTCRILSGSGEAPEVNENLQEEEVNYAW